MEGAATLFLGSEEHPVKAGDHLWFPAGKEEAHHIRNTTAEDLKFLVFGERREADVVVYPEGKVMLVKALGMKQFSYTERTRSDQNS